MKNIICFLLLSFTSFSLAGDSIPDHETLNVVALSGLKLRTTPHHDSKVLDVIPFGQKVKIMGQNHSEEEFVIEWVRGHWINVNWEGMNGFVFSGFLSPLPIPIGENEVTQEDLDLTFPLINWVENNFAPISKNDTISNSTEVKIVQTLDKGHFLVKEHNDFHLKVSVILSDTKIMDVYHLLKSMLLTKYEITEFNKKSVFIKSHDGNITKIKVDIKTPVTIRQLNDGRVKLSAITFFEGC